MLLVHSLLNFLVLALQIHDLFICLPKLFLVHPHMIGLIPFNLLVLRVSPIELKFKVSVGYQEFITFIIQIVKLLDIVSLPFLKVLKFLLQSNFHLSSILSVLIKNVLQMSYDVLLRKISHCDILNCVLPEVSRV